MPRRGLFGFRARFVPMIEDGTKTHTIRALSSLVAAPGHPVALYTALRTKQARLILRAECVKVDAVLIYPDLGEVFVRPYIGIDWLPERPELWPLVLRNPHEYAFAQLDSGERDLLAWRDGFRPQHGAEDPAAGAWAEMREYWLDMHGEDPFIGTITHWKAGEVIRD